MTTVVLLLGLLLLVTIGLASAVRSVRNPRHDTVPSLAELTTELAEQSYRPTARLFSYDDFQFLRAQQAYRPSMERRLRFQRRRVLMLYLTEIRKDFGLLRRWCLVFGRETRNWELRSLAHRQIVVFSPLLLVVRLRCFCNLFVYRPVNTARLVKSLQRLQATIGAVANSLEPRSALRDRG